MKERDHGIIPIGIAVSLFSYVNVTREVAHV